MLQFYFLSVLLNVVVGFVLIYALSARKAKYGDDYLYEGEIVSEGNSSSYDSFNDSADSFSDKPFSAFLNDKIFRMVLGIICAFVGLIKFAYTVQNDVAFVGDLLPALAGLSGGSCLLVGYFLSAGADVPEVVENVFVNGKKFIGIFCVVAGVLHFIFPRVIIL